MTPYQTNMKSDRGPLFDSCIFKGPPFRLHVSLGLGHDSDEACIWGGPTTQDFARSAISHHESDPIS